MSLRDIAHSLFEKAIEQQRPSAIVYESLEQYEEYLLNAKRIFPVAIGKASVEMMNGLLDYLKNNHSSNCLLYTSPSPRDA